MGESSIGRRSLLGIGLAALMGTAVGCHGGGPGSEPTATADPLVITHAFGSTQVPADIARVVTLGWGPTEAALAVGVVPVAIPRGTDNGGDADGYHPWVRQHFREGQPMPAVLSTGAGDAPSIEEVATHTPDLILATEAGLDEDQYTKLSGIAPTIAHPGAAWATPWRETIAISTRSLRRETEGQQVLADLDATTAREAAAHPEFRGRSITAATTYDGQLLIYTGTEPRAQLLTELGFTVDSYGATEPEYDLSLERAGTIQSDLVLLYFSDDASRREFVDGPAASLLAQLRTGRVATVVGAAEVAAVSPPTALSWPWTIDRFTATLSAALRR